MFVQDIESVDKLTADMESAVLAVESLTNKDFESLVANYSASIDDPSVTVWVVTSEEFQQHENKHLPFIKAMESFLFAQFINLGSRGVVYTMKANKRAGYDGVLGFNVETDIHAYAFTEDADSLIMYAYNGLLFRNMRTLVKYLVCQTYRLGKVKPIIDPYSFKRVLFDDGEFVDSDSIEAAEKNIRDFLIT